VAEGRWWKNPFSSLFARSSRDDQLAAYVIREHASGRSLDDILEDPYLRNRSTEDQRRKLVERPDVIRAVGEHTASSAAGGQQSP
jgi:hypothetical protein